MPSVPLRPVPLVSTVAPRMRIWPADWSSILLPEAPLAG